MRLIFIPGFGEEEYIFDHLHPLLPGEKLFVSFWKELPNAQRPGLNAARFAKELIRKYNITADDVVIGHSTGGWVALLIKQHVHCSIVQIASWTDKQKLTAPPINRHSIYFLAKTGLLLNRFTRQWSYRSRYQNKPSAVIFRKVFTRLIEGNKNNVVNQLRLILDPLPESITVAPDLRIHARKDPVVRFPDGRCYEVPGDHFSLYTHPEIVAEPIHQFLQNRC